MFEPLVLVAAVLAAQPVPKNENSGAPLSFCQVARPIYVQIEDYRYLQSTDHGKVLLDDLERFNQAIVNLCGDVPRTIVK